MCYVFVVDRAIHFHNLDCQETTPQTKVIILSSHYHWHILHLSSHSTPASHFHNTFKL